MKISVLAGANPIKETLSYKKDEVSSGFFDCAILQYWDFPLV